MVNLKQFEDLSVHRDPLYGNDLFKVNYRPLDDLSGNPGGTTVAKPKNDMLDDFQEGDIVRGLGLDDEEHQGMIVHIKKDEDGENIEITIEEDGEVVELKASSVHPVEDRGNRSNDFAPPADPGDHPNPDMNTPSMYERNSLKNIKRFSDFNGK